MSSEEQGEECLMSSDVRDMVLGSVQQGVGTGLARV